MKARIKNLLALLSMAIESARELEAAKLQLDRRLLQHKQREQARTRLMEDELQRRRSNLNQKRIEAAVCMDTKTRMRIVDEIVAQSREPLLPRTRVIDIEPVEGAIERAKQ